MSTTIPSTAILNDAADTVAIALTYPDGRKQNVSVAALPPLPPPNPLVVTPTTVTFNFKQGDVLPPAQSVSIVTTGAWKWSDSIKGFNISAESGTGNATLTLKPNNDMLNLPVGKNGGTATVSGSGTSVPVSVVINVTAATGTQPPPAWNPTREPAIARFHNVPNQPWQGPIELLAFASDGIASITWSADGISKVTTSVSQSQYGGDCYLCPIDPTTLSGGAKLLKAVVLTTQGVPFTVNLAMTVGVMSPNYQIITGKTFSGGWPSGPASSVKRLFVNCHLDGGNQTCRYDGSLTGDDERPDYFINCTASNGSNAFRNAGFCINCIDDGDGDDAFSNVVLLNGCESKNQHSVGGSHPDFMQAQIDPLTNAIIYRCKQVTNIDAQGVSFDDATGVAIVDSEFDNPNHWTFYVDGSAQASRGGRVCVVRNLYMRNTVWADGYIGWAAGGGTPAQCTNVVIEKCWRDLARTKPITTEFNNAGVTVR